MQAIMQQIQEWNWLATLPEELEGFELVKELMQCGSQYRIFTYQHIRRQRSFSVLYDQATKEFLARVVVGLTEYTDISFIVGDITTLEKNLEERMTQTIRRLGTFDPATICSIFREKKIADWSYENVLPLEIEGFSLFITPKEPVKVLNGSYIIVDYTDFEVESSLMVYYNIYRDEFFGELRLHRTPKMIAAFDCKTLKELEERLSSHLVETLQELRRQINASGR